MDASVLETIARITAREWFVTAGSQGRPMDGSPDKIAALTHGARALDRLRG